MRNRYGIPQIYWGGRGSGGGGGGKGKKASQTAVAAAASAVGEGSPRSLQGSEKQVSWAESIRDKMNFDSLKGKNANLDTAIRFLESVPQASWWIDERRTPPTDLIKRLVSGLRIGNKTYTMSRDGKFTAKWSEIISDGKGGYRKEFTREVSSPL